VLTKERVDLLQLSQDILDRGALLRFRAHGTSMHPFIKNSNILVVEPLESSSAKIGDVIYCRRLENSFMAHRLIKVVSQNGGKAMLTRGDDLGYFDPAVPIEQVMGRVIRIEGDRKQLTLTGWPGSLFGFLMALFALGHYPQQIRVVRNLGKLWWQLGGRRIK
jgi:hypothetical protein